MWLFIKGTTNMEDEAAAGSTFPQLSNHTQHDQQSRTIPEASSYSSSCFFCCFPRLVAMFESISVLAHDDEEDDDLEDDEDDDDEEEHDEEKGSSFSLVSTLLRFEFCVTWPNKLSLTHVKQI